MNKKEKEAILDWALTNEIATLKEMIVTLTNQINNIDARLVRVEYEQRDMTIRNNFFEMYKLGERIDEKLDEKLTQEGYILGKLPEDSEEKDLFY